MSSQHCFWFIFNRAHTHVASQVVLVVKKLPANTEDIRDVGFLPGLGRSPGGGHGNLSSIFAWIIPMDRGASWATVHRVSKSQTQLKWLSMHYHTLTGFPRSSVVKNPPANAGDATKIPGSGRSLGVGNGNPLQDSSLENPRTEEPGSLQSIALQRVGCDWARMRTVAGTENALYNISYNCWKKGIGMRLGCDSSLNENPMPGRSKASSSRRPWAKRLLWSPWVRIPALLLSWFWPSGKRITLSRV